MTSLLAFLARQDAPLERWIDMLGAERLEDRETARRELRAAGTRAIPGLKRALEKAVDPEIKGALADLLRTVDPPPLEALEALAAREEVELAALDRLEYAKLRKALPDVSFWLLWKKGQVTPWKVMGFDETERSLFVATEAAAWKPYFGRGEAGTVERARLQVALSAWTPHASMVAYPSAPSMALLRVSKDPKVAFAVRADGRTLRALSTSGKVLWERDGDRDLSFKLGSPVIRHVSIENAAVSIVFGKKEFARFDPRTGEFLGGGSD